MIRQSLLLLILILFLVPSYLLNFGPTTDLKIQRSIQSTAPAENGVREIIHETEFLDSNSDSNENKEYDAVNLVDTVNVSLISKPHSDGADFRTRLCNLPQEMVNPEYYEKYCQNNSCNRSGLSCDDHSDCCSRKCINQLCATDQNNKLTIGQICQDRTGCETNICDFHPTENYKICYGRNKPGLCSFNGELCQDRTNCCSNSCIKNRCIGSPQYPSRTGEFCLMDHDECSSRSCNVDRNRCR